MTVTITSVEAELTSIQTAMTSLQALIAQLAADIATLSAPPVTTTPTPTPTATQPALTESANGTAVTTAGTVLYASTTTGAAATGGLDTWTLNASGQVVHNGTADTKTANVTKLYYSNHTVWQYTPANGASLLWWYWTGEVAGKGGAWALNAAGPVPTVTVTPTPTVPPTNAAPTPPPAAVAAGFTKLAFADDFTTTSTIAPSGSATSGYNWYWNTQTQFGTGNYSVNTTATAASINNGNSGGGNNASPVGGILHLIGAPGNSGNMGVLNTMPTNSTTGGQWQHAYFEAYMQSNTANNDGSTSNGWPGFWSWSTKNEPMTEVDFFEYWPPSGASERAYGSLHEWPGNASTSMTSNIYDSNWHTFGCLWTGNGTTGEVSWYYDNVRVGSPVAVGAGTNWPSLEQEAQYIALSAGNPFTVNCDWVKVWTA